MVSAVLPDTRSTIGIGATGIPRKIVKVAKRTRRWCVITNETHYGHNIQLAC